jgi:hypothetical protein
MISLHLVKRGHLALREGLPDAEICLKTSLTKENFRLGGYLD